MIKVSVVVPIYNVQAYLPRCIESLVNQTLEDIQIILVNDGSSDESGDIAKKYEKLYSEKIICVSKENGGLSDARNYGMDFATGEYIAFLDSDDYIEKNAYEEMYNKAKESNSDYVECDFIWEYPNKSKIDKQISYTNIKEMITYVRVMAWNKLIKRNVLVENNLKFPEGLRYEDVEFIYKLIPCLKSFSYVDKPFIHYTQRENSIANVQNERTAEIFTILDNVLRYYKSSKIYDLYKDELEYTYTRYLLCSSLKRICKVKSKNTRNQLEERTWKELNEKFPNWKKNMILNNVNTNTNKIKNKYMRTINKFTYNIYCKIFAI